MLCVGHHILHRPHLPETNPRNRDVGRTIGEATYTDTANMTDENCISYCSSKGFQYAGTEYSQECCTSSYTAFSPPLDDLHPLMMCQGAGANSRPLRPRPRRRIAHRPVPAMPQRLAEGATASLSSTAPSQSARSRIQGLMASATSAATRQCILGRRPGRKVVADFPGSEGTTGRALTYGVGSITAADMTVALCTSACKAAGYILAGVEYADECCMSMSCPCLCLVSDLLVDSC